MHGFSFLGHDPVGFAAADGIDPLAPLSAVLEERVAPVAGLEVPFVGGWVGYLGYEAAACYERLHAAARWSTRSCRSAALRSTGP